jgi:hypothetical protein
MELRGSIDCWYPYNDDDDDDDEDNNNKED